MKWDAWKKNLKGHYNTHTLLEKTSPNSSSQFSLTWHYKLLILHLHWHLFQRTCGNRSQQSPSHSLLFPAQQLELWDFPFPESKARKYFSIISSYCYFRNILMARVPFWDHLLLHYCAQISHTLKINFKFHTNTYSWLTSQYSLTFLLEIRFIKFQFINLDFNLVSCHFNKGYLVREFTTSATNFYF